MKSIYLILLFFVFILSPLCSLLSQNETIINARDQPVNPRWSGSVVWSASLNPDTELEARFLIDDPFPKPGDAFDYQLIVTNIGKKVVTLPGALSLNEVTSSRSDQSYIRANIAIKLTHENTESMQPAMDLFSTPEKPGTALILKPGDSVRLLGRTTLPSDPLPGAKSETVQGFLCVTSVGILVERDGITRSEAENSLWCVNAPQSYRVSYAPRP